MLDGQVGSLFQPLASSSLTIFSWLFNLYKGCKVLFERKSHVETVHQGTEDCEERFRQCANISLKETVAEKSEEVCYIYDTIHVIKEYFNVILNTLDHIIIKKVRAVQEDLVRKESEEATKEEKSEEYEYYYEEEEQAADTK